MNPPETAGAELPQADLSKPRRRWGWHWLVWWQIDQDELAKEITKYHSLGAVRKVSLAFLIFSACTTSLFIYLGWGGVDAWSFVDVAVFLILGIFICFGHRWAMVVAMVVWTAERGFALFGNSQSGAAVTQIVWWSDRKSVV